MAITLRSVKGAPLTNTELDTNFTDLQAAASNAASTAADALAAAQSAGDGATAFTELSDAATAPIATTNTSVAAIKTTADNAASTASAAATAAASAASTASTAATNASSALSTATTAASTASTAASNAASALAGLDTKADLLGPVDISSNTALTKTAHANRTLRISGTGIVLTLNNDTTSGASADEAFYALPVGSATFTMVAGTATLASTTGTSLDSTQTVGGEVAVQRVAADTYKAVSSAISSASLDAALTGLNTSTDSTISATDTAIVAFGKLQAQLNAIAATLVPNAPTGLTLGTATTTTQPLSWTAPASGPALSDYIVEYKAHSSGTWLTFTDGVSTATSATVTGLTAATSYDYRVSSKDGFGAGAPTSTATGSTAVGGTSLFEDSFAGTASDGIDGRAPDVSNAEALAWVDPANRGDLDGSGILGLGWDADGVRYPIASRKDFTIAVKFAFATPSTGQFFVHVRDDQQATVDNPASNSWAVGVNQGGVYIAKQFVNGEEGAWAETVTTGLGPTWADGAQHTLSLVMDSSDNLQVKVDGTNVGSSHAISGSNFGIRLRAQTSNALVDNCKVTTP